MHCGCCDRLLATTPSKIEETNMVGIRCAQHQITKEYYKPYFAKTEPMFIKPREFKLVDRLKPGDWTRSKPENLRP